MGTVDDYLAGLDPADSEQIAGIYAVAREVVPDATQGTGYGMPALLYSGRPLISVRRAFWASSRPAPAWVISR